MTTVTTAEAYKYAAKRVKEGVRAKIIARELARMGYMSIKTGCALTPQAVSLMAQKSASGYVPKRSRQPSETRSRAYLYQPRKKRRKAATEVTETTPNAEAVNTVAVTARTSFDGAYKDIRILAEKHQQIAAALNTLLEAVH